MRGKRTDGELIAEIAELLKLHRPADIVTIMAGRRLPRRTAYRIIGKLRAEDEKLRLEEAEQFRESMLQWTASRLENWQSRKRYKSSDFPPHLWRVRSF